jgi:hypothetical protein
MLMKLDGKTGALIIGAAAILAIIFALAFVTNSNPGKTPIATPMPAPASTPPSSGPTPTYAPKGQVVAGFPKELILDPDAQTSNSYAIKYSSSINQYTAEWSSKASMQSLFTKYQDYFKNNQWTITNTGASQPSFRGLYAKKGNTEGSVAISMQNNVTQVTVGYLKK